MREVNCSVDYSVVVHLDKIAVADLLIAGNKTLAVGAADHQNVATTNLSAVWIFVDFHKLAASSLWQAHTILIERDFMAREGFSTIGEMS